MVDFHVISSAILMCSLVLPWSLCLADEQKKIKFEDVLNLDIDSFDSAIENKYTFTMFFAPWCGHCKNLIPIWEKLAYLYSSSRIQIAKVDCTVETKLCVEENIRGYPSLLFYSSKSGKGVRFTGSRTLEKLVTFIEERQGHSHETLVSPDFEDGVMILSNPTFYKQAKFGDFFVNFYAPWCGHCKRLKPAWHDLAKHYSNNQEIIIAKIDCTASNKICSEYGVKGYPTLLYLRDGKIIEKYEGSREVESMKQFVEKQLASTTSKKSGQGRHYDQLDELVVDLDQETFKKTVAEEGLTFVKFYAPWCGHCKRLAPIWDELGSRYDRDENVVIARVDCTTQEDICNSQGVHAYPTLRLFSDGQAVRDYNGDRTLSNLVDFITRYRLKDEL